MSHDDPSMTNGGEVRGAADANTSANQTFGDIVARRFGRRDLLRGALATTAISAAIGSGAVSAEGSGFDFPEIEAGIDTTHHVAGGYEVQVVLRWGDPLFPGMAAFDPLGQSAAEQARRFGYNNDYLGFFPIEGSSTHGLLAVNHEYTNEELMFPGVGVQDGRQAKFEKMSRELVDIEMAAHGGSVVELRREAGGWRPILGSPYTRRITAETPMEIAGPAAGDRRLETAADPSGRRVLGMLNNCAGGVTAWGTWLSGEENFHYYFWGALPEGHLEAGPQARYGLGAPHYAWGKFHPRFDRAREPNEANRFGWVVETDPFDPSFTPRKRTALGRMSHEGAAGALTADGRYAVYMGDDARFEYVYKFVTSRRVNTTDRRANLDLLDAGTLYAARFDADGTGGWLPLTHGQGGLDHANGFASQADLLIETRRAADILGATKMDRPEDIEASPTTGRVYVMLTNNSRRPPEEVNPANPRPSNRFGHIVEIEPDGGDHAAPTFRWEVMLRCGDPAVGSVGATFSSDTTRNGWFGMPDNCAFDSRGRLWIATDGNSRKATGRADGIWAVETDGPSRRRSKHFFRGPAGAEICGPFFTPDDSTLFLAVQHPGEADDGIPSTYDNPSTRWPDFRPDMPPRPSVVAITRRGGGRIG